MQDHISMIVTDLWRMDHKWLNRFRSLFVGEHYNVSDSYNMPEAWRTVCDYTMDLFIIFVSIYLFTFVFFWVAGVGGILTSSGPTASSQYNSPRGKYSKLRDWRSTNCHMKSLVCEETFAQWSLENGNISKTQPSRHQGHTWCIGPLREAHSCVAEKRKACKHHSFGSRQHAALGHIRKLSSGQTRVRFWGHGGSLWYFI